MARGVVHEMRNLAMVVNELMAEVQEQLLEGDVVTEETLSGLVDVAERLYAVAAQVAPMPRVRPAPPATARAATAVTPSAIANGAALPAR